MAHVRQSRFSQFMSIFRLIVLTVIAIALVKFAFFPPKDDAAGVTIDPSFAVPQLTITTEKTSINNSLNLKGTIQANPAQEVKSTSEGIITTVFINDGQNVSAGDDLFELKREIIGEDREVTDEAGNISVEPGRTTYKYSRVKAPIAGTVTINALVGQSFSIGDVVATISPRTFSAQASLSPEQMYRIIQLPPSATVTIKDGPAPFECTDLKVNAGSSSSSNELSESENTGGLALSCAIPAQQKVFSGLAITLDVIAGEAKDVMTLPVTAVEGRFGDGFVYLPSDDPQKPTKHPVKLGLTDGDRIEIVEGLKADQEVLEFTPLQREEKQCDPMTGEGC